MGKKESFNAAAFLDAEQQGSDDGFDPSAFLESKGESFQQAPSPSLPAALAGRGGAASAGLPRPSVQQGVSADGLGGTSAQASQQALDIQTPLGLPELDRFGVAKENPKVAQQVATVQKEMGLDPAGIARTREKERVAKAQEGLARIASLPKDVQEWAPPPQMQEGGVPMIDPRWSRIMDDYRRDGQQQFTPEEIAVRREAGTWGPREDARERTKAFMLQQGKINERSKMLRGTYEAIKSTRDIEKESAALQQEGAALEEERGILESGQPTQQQVDAYNTKLSAYQQRQQEFTETIRPIAEEEQYLNAWQNYVTEGLTNAEALKALDPKERELLATQLEADASGGGGYTGTVNRFFRRLGGNIAGTGLRLMNLAGNIPNRAAGESDYYSPFAYLADKVDESLERIDAEKPSEQKTDIFTEDFGVNPGFLHKMLDGVLYAGALAVGGASGGVRGMTALGMAGSSEDYYREGVESGLKPQDAEIVSLLLSGTEASIEALNLGPFVNSGARKSIMRGAVDAIKKGAAPKLAAKESFVRYMAEQTGAEAGEEVLTSVAQSMVKKGAEMATGVDQDTELTAQGLAGDALMGAVLGGLMGGVGRLSQRPIYKEGVAWAVQNAAEFRQYVQQNIPKEEQGPILERFEMYEKVYRGLPSDMKSDTKMTVAHAVAEKERLKKERSSTVIDETVASAIGDMNTAAMKEQDEIIADALGVDLVDLAKRQEAQKLQEAYDKQKLKSEITGKPMPEGSVRPKVEEADTRKDVVTAREAEAALKETPPPAEEAQTPTEEIQAPAQEAGQVEAPPDSPVRLDGDPLNQTKEEDASAITGNELGDRAGAEGVRVGKEPAPPPTDTQAPPRVDVEAEQVAPAKIKSGNAGTAEADEYVKEWGEFAFGTKKAATEYANRLAVGEGGNWVAEKVGKKWRAHRTDYAGRRIQEGFDAASAERKKESAEEARLLNEEFEARQEAFLQQYPEAEADLMRTEEKIAAGTPLTAKEVVIANENIFRPSGYDFDESGGITKAAPVEASTRSQADAIDKAYKSASRFKPSKRVEFGSPITGPSGAKLTAYEWKYKFEEYVDSRGEDRVKRVSDWDMAELSDETGRDIVHQFEVVDDNGRGSLVSAESALKIMGYMGGIPGKDAKSMMSAAKTLAGHLMQLDGLRAELQIEKDAKAKIAKTPRPDVVVKSGSAEARGLAKKRKNETWSMGDAEVWVMYPEDGALSNDERSERLKTLEWAWENSELKKLGVNPYARTEQKIAEVERKIATKERQLGGKVKDAPARASQAPATAEAPLQKEKKEPAKPKAPTEEVKPASKPAPIEEKAKTIADRIRAGKLKGKGLKSSIPGFEQAWDAALEAAAITVEAGGDAAQAISDAIKALKASDWWKKADKAERDEQQQAVTDYVNESVSEDKPKKKAEPKEGREVKKTILTQRAYEGDFRREVKKELEKIGLTRTTETFEEAEEKAKKIIENLGVWAALDAVMANDVKGGAKAFIWEEALKDLNEKFENATSQEELDAIAKKQGEIIAEMSAEYTSAGQASSALQVIYARGDLGFKSEHLAQEWEKSTGEKPSDEQMAKWREQDKEFEALRKKLEDAEKRAQEAEANASVKAIKDSVDKQKARDAGKTNTRRAKELADRFRTLKTKPFVFTDSKGNRVEVKQMGIDFNELIEIGAKAIEAAGELADKVSAAMNAIVEKLKSSAFYNSLEEADKEAFLQQLEDEIRGTLDEDIEEGRIRIPKKLIRAAVEAGAEDINTLVAVIKEQIQEFYPDITDREVRDAITEYGKVVSMSKDEIDAKIRRMKRMGRDLSILEDIQEQKRPLRSGLQRDKLDAEERAMKKRIREAMKELPVDEAAQERELKSALDAAKTRVRNRIEDLEREIEMRDRIRKSTKTVEPDAELEALIEQKDELEAIREEVFEDAGLLQEEKMERLIAATERSAEKYEQRVKDRILENKKPYPVQETPELRAARDRRDAAKAELKALQERMGVIRRNRLDAAKKAANRYVTDLERRIAEKDFAPKVRKPIIADTELIALNAQKLRMREEFEKEMHKHKILNRNRSEKLRDTAIEAWQFFRYMNASLDLSFIGIQGGAMTISNLWRNPRAVRDAFVNMRRSMASEKRSEEWHRRIRAQSWYPEAKKAGLAITEPHAEVTAREELFMSEWTRAIWNTIGLPARIHSKAAHERWMALNPFRAVERGASAYLDSLRIERYLSGMAVLEQKMAEGEEVTDKDKKDIADMVNTLTGRGTFKFIENNAKGLSLAFYSPKLWASAIKTSTPYALWYFGRMSPTARKLALQDMGRFVGTTMGLVMMAALYFNNDDDDETGVEMDPRSSDFMKIKIGKNRRLDPWGGKIQQVVFTTRLAIGALSLANEQMGGKSLEAYKKTSGDVFPLGVKFKSPSMGKLGMQMLTNKLAPAASLAVETAFSNIKEEDGEVVRRDDFGNEILLKDEFMERLTPMYVQTVMELAKDDPGAVEGFLMLSSFIAYPNLQEYEEKDKTKKNTRSRRALEAAKRSLRTQ